MEFNWHRQEILVTLEVIFDQRDFKMLFHIDFLNFFFKYSKNTYCFYITNQILINEKVHVKFN